MLVLSGPRVVLRPFRREELERVRAAQERLFPSDAPDEASARALAARLERSGRLLDGWLDLAIEAGGRLVGDIGARRPPGALPPGVFELGVSLFDPGDRGRGYGREAVELLTGHLFAREGAARVQASTVVGNAAMRRVLERVGFVGEGTLRAFMPGRGEREDYALYAVTRDDWTKLGERRDAERAIRR